MTSRSVTVANRLGLHARAAARFVHVASRFRSQIRVTKGSQTMDGKSIMGILLLAAAAGTTLTVSADGARRAGGHRRALRVHRNRVRRGHVQRLSGIGVSPGVGAGRAVLLIQRAQVLRFSISSLRIRAEIARLEDARRRSAEQLHRIQARLPGGDLGALFEAQRLMLDDPMLLPRAASIVERTARQLRVGAPAGIRPPRRHIRRGRRSVPERAQGRPGGCRRAAPHEPHAGRRGFSRCARTLRVPLRARGRRAAAIDCRAARLEQVSGLHYRTPGAGRITRRFSRGRCTCRPSSACTTPRKESLQVR